MNPFVLLSQISLTDSGKNAMWILLAIALYSGWRWSYLGQTFGKGGTKYFFVGVLTTIGITLPAFAIIAGVGVVLFGTRGMTAMKDTMMTGIVFATILLAGFLIRRHFWKKLTLEKRGELDQIGENH